MQKIKLDSLWDTWSIIWMRNYVHVELYNKAHRVCYNDAYAVPVTMRYMQHLLQRGTCSLLYNKVYAVWATMKYMQFYVTMRYMQFMLQWGQAVYVTIRCMLFLLQWGTNSLCYNVLHAGFVTMRYMHFMLQ